MNESWKFQSLCFFLICVLLTPGLRGEMREAPKSLAESLLSYEWSWEEYTNGRKRTQSISFYRGGFAKNRPFFSAHWEVTGRYAIELRNTNVGTPNANKTIVLTFNKDFTHFEGIDFNGETKVEGSHLKRVDPNRPSPAGRPE